MEDKAKICRLLLPVLQETRALSELQDLTYDKEKELVYARFPAGTLNVNVAMDSGIIMIQDIIRKIV